MQQFLLFSTMSDGLVQDRDAAWALLASGPRASAAPPPRAGVEASVRAYARKLGERGRWANVALLHDSRTRRHPTLDKHPQDGAPVLREKGYPEGSPPIL